jgi:YHS domain-containing protein
MAILGNAEKKARQEKDPVCGMLVVVDLAVGPEKAAGGDGEVWFCSLGCQAQYQAEQEKVGAPERDRWPEPKGVEA